MVEILWSVHPIDKLAADLEQRSTSTDKPSRVQADLALAFCSLLCGATFVVVKNSLNHASVFVFLAVRFSVAAVLMLAWSNRALRRFEREDLFAGLRLGGFMFLGYAFQTAGLQCTTPSKSGFDTGSSVLLVPLLLALFWGKRLAWGSYAGALVAVLGLYYLTIPAEGIAHSNRGGVLTFMAAGLYAVHIILLGEYTLQHSAKALSLIQVAACAAVAWVTAGAAAAIRWQPARFEWRFELILGILRRLRHRARFFHSALGAAIHHAGPRRNSLHARAGFCSDYFLHFNSRTAQSARPARRVVGPSWNCRCRHCWSARVARTDGREKPETRKVKPEIKI
jgi:drug/metabolite transporter (DMT)-like permease